MEFWRKCLCASLIAVLYFWNPFYIRSTVVDITYAALQSAHLAHVHNPNSLKAAISNVTGDFDQLATLVEDFFDRLPNNSTELMFRDYLRSKAAQSHKDFEYCLDWLLSLYNILWPFVAMYAILKLSNREDSGSRGAHGRRPVSKKGSEEHSIAKRQHGHLKEHGSDPDLLALQASPLRHGSSTAGGHQLSRPNRSLSVQSLT